MVSPTRRDTHRWRTLISVSLGIMTVGLAGTVASVANPTIGRDLRASLADLQWETTASKLAFLDGLHEALLVVDRRVRRRSAHAAVPARARGRRRHRSGLTRSAPPARSASPAPGLAARISCHPSRERRSMVNEGSGSAEIRPASTEIGCVRRNAQCSERYYRQGRMSPLRITEYTDPACPFAWSAEPARRRVEWLYGDQLSWELCMVGLHENAADLASHGLTTETLAAGQARLAHAHHMPMDTAPRPRLAASVPACRAVVATRLNAPAHERAMLRALRVESFSGDGALLDEPETLRRAARDAGLDPADLDRWLVAPETEQALRGDLRRARSPSPEALALAHTLASSGDGGHRYTCPSYELSRDGRHLSVPGFQAAPAYEIAIANLAPALTRRPTPAGVSEVLRWAGEPLATAEVAAVCAIELDDARERLGRVATERHIGFEGLWSLPDDA